MAGRELGCPDSTYEYLQRVRDHLIMAKIELSRYEREAEEFKRLGWHEEAERTLKLAHSYVSIIRQLEDEIKELEKLCFGREKRPQRG